MYTLNNKFCITASTVLCSSFGCVFFQQHQVNHSTDDEMSKLGSPKRAFMLFMGLLLYIILVALLMFYIEECSVDGSNAQKTSDPALFRKQCRLIFASFNLSSTTSGANPNISFDGCTKLVRELTPKQYWKTPTCRFSVINYLPWVHCVTFSLLTLGKLTSFLFVLTFLACIPYQLLIFTLM